MKGMKFNDHISPDKSNFLIIFLKTFKDRISLYESGIKFHSFGSVNVQDFKPYVLVMWSLYEMIHIWIYRML